MSNEQNIRRLTRNSWLFIITFFFTGALSGIAYDAMTTYAQEISASVAAGFSIYLGLGTFIAAIILLLVPKLGYKIVLGFSAIVAIGSFLLTNISNNEVLVTVAVLGVLLAISLFEATLPPYLTAYTTSKNRQKFFSRALYLNVLGMVLSTKLGGLVIVWRFGNRIGKSFNEAKALTTKIAEFTAVQKSAYLLAHKDLLLMCVALGVLCFLPILFIKQEVSDYRTVEKTEEKTKFDIKVFANKYVILFLVYTIFIRLGSSLIMPYISIFLGKLGIDRSTVSTISTLQYGAMVIFMIVSPWVVKKIGQVKTLGYFSLASVPFMLLICNGKAFGPLMTPVVTMSFFLRSGFMNAAYPVSNSLPMEFVEKDYRPAYNSIIFVTTGVCSILSGIFAKTFLFKLEGGYSYAYYITSVLYATAAIIILVAFTKKYNRSFENADENETTSESSVEV
ncbi:MFS transporter [Hathewaya histolytica]|uniref:Major facilitator family transporter n=1 Tax=Hathewaya histolytica TaxID=1498 RepID=A0A4U9QXR4_HATHI|nr:MFS transporter [Hathewaya histolytica]VTQ82303.1 major facilitator family transporter [Hathewaya histolytica]